MENASKIKIRIQEDMKNAMRAKEVQRLGVIRLILAAIKQKEIDERIELDEQQVLVILDKMLKQRRESLNQFEGAGRQDLADKEKFEITIIEDYLPQPLSSQEIDEIINTAIKSVAATEQADMGKVMAYVKPKVQGRADMREVSEKIKEKLR